MLGYLLECLLTKFIFILGSLNIGIDFNILLKSIIRDSKSRNHGAIESDIPQKPSDPSNSCSVE